jgi:hypothetical protein
MILPWAGSNAYKMYKGHRMALAAEKAAEEILGNLNRATKMTNTDK